MLPFFKKNPSPAPISKRSYLFAIEIGPAVVKTAIWSVVNDKPQVLSVGRVANWDDNSTTSLIEAVDQSLSDGVNHLDPSGKLEIDQVIFGLPPTWVSQDKINSDKLQFLKSLSTKLDLKPVGFVVTPEAAVKFLAHTENVPSTAILLGFWPHILEVTLVRMGRVDGIHHVKRSDDIAQDVVEGLSRFPHVDTLPSRIMLYDSGMDLEEVKQLLLAYPWQAPQKKLPFLHFPKVEILPPDFTVRAIATAGGSEVARAIGLLPDIPETPPVVHEDTPNVESTLSAQDLGFTPDQEIINDPPTSESSYEPEPLEVTAPIMPAQSSSNLPEFSLPKISPPHFSWPRLSLIAVVIPVILLLAGLFAAYWYLPRSTVTLFVAPKNISTNFDAELPGQTLEVTVSADKTSPATGSKLVGDRATGIVTIENGLDSSHKFPAGTVITSPSGLKFILDQEVTVASASGSIGNLVLGKATVKVTASTIGSDSNLSAATVFRVGTFAVTQIDAKNEAAFSGGTSRQAKAVSKDDIAKLRTDLTATLKDQAKTDLLAKVTSDQTIIDESIILQTVSEDLDHKVDEPADNVKLKLTVKARGSVVSKSDLQNLVDAKIKPIIPEGYSEITQISQNINVKKVDKTLIFFTGEISASVLPNSNQADIVDNILGKSPTAAKAYLETLPGVSQIDILITPHIPLLPVVLPHLPKNIILSIKSSQ